MKTQNGRMAELVDIVVEDDRWLKVGLELMAAEVCAICLGRLDLDPAGFEIALLACDDKRIAALNGDFRAKVQATNVLSWPAEDLAPAKAGAAPRLPKQAAGMATELGDIAIAFDTCQAEAADQGKALGDHVAHLLAHGTLHLLGYDHVHDKDAALMEGLEVAILAKLGIADPY